MNLVLVGQNPSLKNLDYSVPFKGARSYDKLMEWVMYLKITGDTHMLNITETPGKVILTEAVLDDFGPRLIDKLMELEDESQDYKIISLGVIADTVLNLINIEHFALPHPSGRNRLLNDEKYVARLLNECYAYIHED